jgi:menaquinone-9 beta-reductase
MIKTISTDHPITIIGAGPAGATCALALAKKNIPSILIDKAVFPRDKICGDALSGAVVAYLNRLDPTWVNEIIDTNVGLGSHGIRFFAPNGKSIRLKFPTSNILDKEAPGYVSKRIVFDNYLIEKVKANHLITLIENEEIKQYSKTENGWDITTKTGMMIHSALVISCDGAYSGFAKDHAGLETEKIHNCFGIRQYYKNVAFEDPENFIELHFIKDILPGYFWIFQMPNGEFNVGMGMRADVLGDRKVNLKKKLEEIITTHPDISKRFSRAEKVEDVKLWGLPMGSKKRKLYGEHFILCGDAAMLIDPFTGEGISNAMCSGWYAAEQIATITDKKYSDENLKGYQDHLERVLMPELRLSTTIQHLSNISWLFNFVVNKIANSPKIQKVFANMMGSLEERKKLSTFKFYWDLLRG